MSTPQPHTRAVKAAFRASMAALSGLAMVAAFAQTQTGPQATFERVARNVWVVQAADAQGRVLSTGSAVAIAPGKVVTSCQLLAKASQLSVRRDNVSYGASLDLPDPERDLCQLRVPNLPANALAIVSARELQVGMPLYAVGSPRGKELALDVSMLSAVRRANDGALEALQLAAAPEAGMGGAGVFDAQGRLVAVLGHSSGSEPISRLAMPAAWIEDLPLRGKAAIESIATQPQSTGTASGTITGSAGFRTMEYTFRDRLTRVSRTAVYRLDSESAERRSFNNGGWIEKPSGEVIQINTPIAGEFDSVMPPGGWVPASLLEDLNWRTKYDVKRGGVQVGMDLRAQVDGNETIQVLGRNREVVRIVYRGYVSRAPVGGNLVSSNPTGTLRGYAWYSPELARVVRFEIKEQGGIGSGAFMISEEVELTGLQ